MPLDSVYDQIKKLYAINPNLDFVALASFQNSMNKGMLDDRCYELLALNPSADFGGIDRAMSHGITYEKVISILQQNKYFDFR